MACKVQVNRHGYLAFRLYWNGIESWEGTGLKDTPRIASGWKPMPRSCRKRMERGEFDYLKWFPNGSRADEFRPKVPALEQRKLQTVKEF